MKSATTLLVFCVSALVCLGMVMLFSAGMVKGEAGAQYFIKQSTWCLAGVVICCIAASRDYRILRSGAWILYGLTIVLLVLVLIPGIGAKIGGARRWFRYGSLSVQPSELAKLALIVVLAWYGEKYQRHMKSFKRGGLYPGLAIAVILGLIFVEVDVGTTILLAALTSVMLLIAGIRWAHFLPPVTVIIAVLALFIWQDPMRSSRIYSWLHLEETKLGRGMQAWQARVALGSGGWKGLGLGDGRQKLGFVPEHHTDFIFSIIGEELGLIATLGVVAVFGLLVAAGMYISTRAPDLFGLLLGTGITFLIGLQAFINIGVVTGTLPNKGLPLPFISYGGSNLFVMLGCIGILLSIARQAPEHANDTPNPFASQEVVAPQMT